MPGNPLSSLSFQDAPSWVSDLVTDFEAAWQRGRPDLAAFLPSDPERRPLALVHLAAVDLECCLGARVEDYLKRFPELAQDEAGLFLLVAVEWDMARLKQGASLTDFVKRFPQFEEQLKALSFRQEPPTINEPPQSGATSSSGSLPPLRYLPMSFHAAGNLGEVHVAHDAELNRAVALKRIQERHAHQPDLLQRFLREAEVTGRLEHPGVVPVYGLGQDADGRPCYAMRFIQGEAFKEAIDRNHQGQGDPSQRRLELRRLLTRFVAVCNTMAYAHSRGILHRDLKPANIMLGKYGETLVVDWGLAKAVDRDEAARTSGEASLTPTLAGGMETQAGHVVGTPAYMSPEQAAGLWELVGPASDIFSLGATLYTLLTGKAPYEGKSAQEVVVRAIQGEFLAPRQRRADLPRPLEAICLKALAKKKEDRYVTALELAEDVEHWLADEPVSAYREGPAGQLGRWLRRHRGAAGTGMVSAILITIPALAAVAVINAARKTAEDNQKLAEKRKEESDQLRVKAQEQQQLAEAAKNNAESNQRLADQRKEESERRGREADEQRREAELNLYFNRIALADREYFANNVARSVELLEACRPGADRPDQRAWEWHYLRRRAQAGVVAILQQNAPIYAVIHSSKANRVCTDEHAGWMQAEEGSLRVYDLDNCKELFRIPGHIAPRFSPDGSLLATTKGSTIFLSEASNGREIRRLWWPSHYPDRLTFSPNGKFLATSYSMASRLHPKSKRLGIWDTVKGRILMDVEEYTCPQFSPDSNSVACCNGSLVPAHGADFAADDVYNVN